MWESIKELFKPNDHQVHVHEWGPWKPYQTGMYWQRRECATCGYTEEEKIGDW